MYSFDRDDVVRHEQEKKMRHKRLSWIRLIILISGIIFIVGGVTIGILNIQGVIQGHWSDILALLLFPAFGLILSLLALLYQSSPKLREVPPLPNVEELDRTSLHMGDEAAANFPFITTLIVDIYNAATQALVDASTGSSTKHGILILGKANAGKTRLAIEAMKETLKDWPVFCWTSEPTIDQLPLNNKRLIVYIDDLQDYGKDANSSTAFRNLLGRLRQMVQCVVVVATCRTENEAQVKANLIQLFEELTILTVPTFKRYGPEAEQIITAFQEKGQEKGLVHIEDWDGTLGSLVLGLSRKQSQYESLIKEDNNAATVLHAMKLLNLAGIIFLTRLRIQTVCSDVFGEKLIKNSAEIWEKTVSKLTKLQFVTEERDSSLAILKDVYFDKVIEDYPSVDRPFQLEQHLVMLRDTFVLLKDVNALIDLGETYNECKHYDEALDTYEKSIRLDPNAGIAYKGKGDALYHLDRVEEALKAYEQAILLDSDFAPAYQGKGDALYHLNRVEEALKAYEQAIFLDSDFAPAYQGKGDALYHLRNYVDALTAYQQTLTLDPNNLDARGHTFIILTRLGQYQKALALEKTILLDPNIQDENLWFYKGISLAGVGRYQDAMIAYEHALALEPNNAEIWLRKGIMHARLKLYKEALDAYEQALAFNPNNFTVHYLKGRTLLILNRREEALSLYDDILSRDPDNNEALHYKANWLYKLGQYKDSLIVCNHILDLTPLDEEIKSLRQNIMGSSKSFRIKSKSEIDPIILAMKDLIGQEKAYRLLLNQPLSTSVSFPEPSLLPYREEEQEELMDKTLNRVEKILEQKLKDETYISH